MAGNKSKTEGMRPKGSAKSTSAGVQNAPATEASPFLFKTATAPTAEAAPASTPRNPFILASDSTTKSANPTITSASTTTAKKSPKKPLSKEEYLAQAERRYLASRARAVAELRKVYRTRCPFAKRAVKRYAQRRSQWEASRRKLQKAGAFLEKTMGALSNPQGISASASRTPQKTSPKLSPEPSSAKPSALPQTSFSVDDHLERDTSKAPSVASSSDETVKSDTRTVDSLSTNITTPDLSDCDSLVKSTTKATKQKTASPSAAPSQTKADVATEQPRKSEKFKITINVEPAAPSKEAKESAQNTKADAAPTSSGALTPKKSPDQKQEKKQDAQELKKEKKSKKHKRDEDDDKEEGASTEEQQQPKAKKPKTSAEPPTCSGAAVMSPASSIDKTYKPYPNVPPEVRKELFIIKAEEMIFNPLGYDDLVYDDTRPKNKRPKWRKVGRNTGPSDLMMSGGIGPADGSGPLKSSKKKNRGDDDSLSKQVLKKGHNKRVAEEVVSLKQQKSSESSFGEQKREKGEFKKNKHHHQQGGNNKSWKHNKQNNSASLAAKFRRHK